MRLTAGFNYLHGARTSCGFVFPTANNYSQQEFHTSITAHADVCVLHLSTYAHIHSAERDCTPLQIFLLGHTRPNERQVWRRLTRQHRLICSLDFGCNVTIPCARKSNVGKSTVTHFDAHLGHPHKYEYFGMRLYRLCSHPYTRLCTKIYIVHIMPTKLLRI